MVDLHCAPSRLLEASSSDHHHGEGTLLLRHLLLQLPPPPLLLLLLLMLLRNYHRRRSCWEVFPSCASSAEWKTTVTVEADVVAEVVMMTKTGEAAAVAGEVAVAEVVAAAVEEGGRSCLLLLSLHHAELCSSCHQVRQGVPRTNVVGTPPLPIVAAASASPMAEMQKGLVVETFGLCPLQPRHRRHRRRRRCCSSRLLACSSLHSATKYSS